MGCLLFWPGRDDRRIKPVPDVVFAGGGVIGLASALLSARRGLNVTVADPSPGQGASWVAAGMLAPVGEAHYGEEALVGLLVAAAARWPTFAADLEAAAGQAVGFRPCGTVAVAVDGSDRAALDELVAFQRSLGLDARPLSGSESRRLVPALAPGVRGGALMPDDHQVDNRRLVGALLEACRRAGVDLVPAAVTAVQRSGDGAAGGVALDDGSTLVSRSVVLAMGCETGLLEGLPPGTLPPVRPVKGHVVRLRGPASNPLLERTVRGLVHGRSCYLVPRADGSLVVGATVEEQGFDRRVQAGAVHSLLDDARTLVPGVDELELVECIAGLRPGTPDNAPYIGWTDVPGLLVATGHYRNGILLAPITADAVSALLAGEPVPAAVAPFGMRREEGAGRPSPGVGPSAAAGRS
jgi:glycine oxidase